MDCFFYKICRRLNICAILTLMSCAEARSSKGQQKETPFKAQQVSPIMPLTELERRAQEQASAKAQKVQLIVVWNGQNLPSSDVILSFYGDPAVEPSWVVTWKELLSYQDGDDGCSGEKNKTVGMDIVTVCNGRFQNPASIRKIVARDPSTETVLTSFQPGTSLLPDGTLNMLALFY